MPAARNSYRKIPELKSSTLNLLDRKWVFGLLLVLILACGAFLRYSDLSAPLLDFHPTRQLFGAIKARGLYYQTLPDAPAWQKSLAVRQYEGEATIEPPLMEHLSADLYTFFGAQTAVPRAVSSSFWLLGGLFLFLLARNLSGSAPAAALSLAFYLLLPYAVSASRAFQPDPLMVMLLIIFWWGIENWSRHLSWKWALISGLAGGLAIFIKFPVVFFVIGGALGLIFGRVGLLKSIKTPQTWGIVLLGILPPAIYLYYGTVLHGFLGQQFGDRFYPELWITPIFYLRWFLKVQDIASILWIGLTLLGCFVFSSKPVRAFLGGLWAAYFVFGLTFAHHISSHDYYSLPLIPILALGLAPLAAAGLSALQTRFFPDAQFAELDAKNPTANRISGTFPQVFILIILVSSLLLYTVDQYLNERTNDYRPQAAFWAQVGDAIGHQPGVLALTTDYGYSLAYYGWQNSSPWPPSVSAQEFRDTFKRLASNKTYFLVTDFDEYNRQPELQKQLTENYPILAQSRDFIVFDLYHPKK